MNQELPKNLYFTILEFLYTESGVNIETDITNLLSKHFLNHDDVDRQNDLKQFDIDMYLLPMKEAKHILYTSEFYTNVRPVYTIVKAKITPEGALFYYQKMQIDVVMNSNYWAKRNIIATLVLAVLAFGVSIGAFIKSFYDSDSKQQISQQQTKIKDQEIALKKLTILLNRKPSKPD